MGASLEVIRPENAFDLPENWRASPTPGGTPGRVESETNFSIDDISIQTGEIRLKFNGLKGMGYTVLASASLSPATWEIITHVQPLANDQQVEVSIALNHDDPSRYFQVSIP